MALPRDLLDLVQSQEAEALFTDPQRAAEAARLVNEFAEQSALTALDAVLAAADAMTAEAEAPAATRAAARAATQAAARTAARTATEQADLLAEEIGRFLKVAEQRPA